MGNRSEVVRRRRNRSGWRLEGSADHLEAPLASPVASLASLRRDRDHHNRHKARREEEGQGQGLMVARRVRAARRDSLLLLLLLLHAYPLVEGLAPLGRDPVVADHTRIAAGQVVVAAVGRGYQEGVEEGHPSLHRRRLLCLLRCRRVPAAVVAAAGLPDRAAAHAASHAASGRQDHVQAAGRDRGGSRRVALHRRLGSREALARLEKAVGLEDPVRRLLEGRRASARAVSSARAAG